MCKKDRRIKKIEHKIDSLYVLKDALIEQEIDEQFLYKLIKKQCERCRGLFSLDSTRAKKQKICNDCTIEVIDLQIEGLYKKRDLGLSLLIKKATEVNRAKVIEDKELEKKIHRVVNTIKGSGIYFIWDDNNKRIYVGKSINIESRLKTHLYDIANNKHIVEPLNRINPDTLQYDFISQEDTGVEDLETLERIIINYVDEGGMRMYNQYMHRLVLSDYAQILERVGPMVDKVLEETKATPHNRPT